MAASRVIGRKGDQAESNHCLVGSKGFALGGSRAEPWPCFLPWFPQAGNGHEVLALPRSRAIRHTLDGAERLVQRGSQRIGIDDRAEVGFQTAGLVGERRHGPLNVSSAARRRCVCDAGGRGLIRLVSAYRTIMPQSMRSIVSSRIDTAK